MYVGVGVGACTLERSAKDWNMMTLERWAGDPSYRTLQAFSRDLGFILG